MKKNSFFKRSKGFSLLEMSLVIAILLVVMVLEMKKNVIKVKEIEIKAMAHQINTVGNAVEQYMLKHELALKTMSDPNCPTTGDQCALSFNALISDGDLPATFSNTTPTGGGYEIYITRVPPPPAPQLGVFCGVTNPIPLGCPDQSGNIPAKQWKLYSAITTHSPVNMENTTTVDLHTQIVGGLYQRELSSLGSQSAFNSDGTYIMGFKGNFRGYLNLFPGVSGLYTFKYVYVGGKDFNVWNNFLKKDGTNQMTGPLDMGGYKILNMRDMFINGSPTNPRNKNLSSLLPNWVFKGVYTVPKGTFGPGGENADDYIPPFIPAPICGNGGQPKIKVLTQLMKGTSANYYQFDRFIMNSMNTAIAQYSSGAITDQQYHDITQSMLNDRKAKRAMQTWAVPRTPFTGWDVYIKEFYRQTDADTQIGRLGVYGEGLAELYCYYPDQ